MTRRQAEELVTLLAAAFPTPQPPDATLALYIEGLVLLPNAETAREAIEELYRDPSTTFLPALGAIHEAYWKVQRDAAERRARAAAARGLPSGKYPPPPAEVVEQFAAMGIDLHSMLKTVDVTPATRRQEGGRHDSSQPS
jgi:hypothetical protein